MTASDSELNHTGLEQATGAEAAAAEVAAPDDYAVGRGKPPKAHQFQKGNRANPGGKKRKVKGSEEVVPQLPNDSLHGMLMAETQRMVRVKAGGRYVEIPAMQVAFRAVAMRAAQGNRLAMATLARLVMQSEAAEARAAGAGAASAPASSRHAAWDTPHVPASAVPGYAAAVEYKEVWTRVLTKAALLTAELATPVPHPDEVMIGHVRGTADWPGAQADDTLSLDQLAATHADLQAELPARRPGIEAMADGYDKAIAWCEWFALVDMRDLIAAHLPARYAWQIHADTRSAAERSRDDALRSMARHDQFLHGVRADRKAADDARQAAMRGPSEARWHGDGGDEGDEDDGSEGADKEDGDEAGRRALPKVEITGNPARAVAEASAYCDAWTEVIELTEGMKIRIEPPMPPPGDVVIDADLRTVVYREPPEPGRRATLKNLRATLTGMKAKAAEYNADIICAPLPRFAEMAEGKRDDMLTMCAVVEWHLGKFADEGHEPAAAPPPPSAASRARTVAVASAYRAAWLEMLEQAEILEVQPGKPMPPPEDVMIDTEAVMVTYRTPPAPGQRATLTSLRATLARMKDLADGHDGAMASAPYPQRMFIYQRRRDEAFRYCDIIERHLAGVERKDR
ncbi:hypothetical protein ACVWZA_002752 [Sphingomonas sp. UYAg733]